MISVDAQIEYLHKEMNAVCAPQDRWYLVAHSVGGATAALFAAAYPDRVEALISVEGKFTSDDAFWSQKLPKIPLEEVETTVADDRSKPEKAGEHAFTNGSIITGAPANLDGINGWVDDIPLHLIAVERSAHGWHIPARVKEKAAS
jgi:pimeloyl-ACP methyl ester carboxylesterase